MNVIEELKSIKDALKKYPNGALIEDIENQLSLKIMRRTLQRRLLALQNVGALRIEGKTRATKYFLIDDQASVTETNEGIFLSKEGKEILKVVKQPLQQRIPVGYRRDFIDSYQANVSAYLSSNELERLEKIGKIAPSNQELHPMIKTKELIK